MPDQPAATDVRLTAADAAELADLLVFLRDWLTTSEDSELLTASLERFPVSVGTDTGPALQIALRRFASLLTPTTGARWTSNPSAHQDGSGARHATTRP